MPGATKIFSRTLYVVILFFAATSISFAKPLKAEIVDPSWNGTLVPKGQQCDRFGGKGSTPEMLISGLPKGTEIVVLEFSDRHSRRMNNGGHGSIAMLVEPNASELKFPSVAGHTFTLPPGVILVREHRNPDWDIAGAYMPPCSGGNGNYYYVKVIAAKIKNIERKKFKKIKSVKLPIGRY